MCRTYAATPLSARRCDDGPNAQRRQQNAEALRVLLGAQRSALTLRGVDTTTATRRLAGLLARKGYPAGMAFAVVRDELGAVDDDPT